ncbi:MICOS complex subunit MIC13 [Myxocyprinus asiaticus]|uniref:MICOS complex subunit MIC13 n=1 Tax=Myxocyprinus asiaticus TaxID=70543 RepID=UPI00222191F8|nr:MICOS complex subunit MIC13 [Myxocyprinus asiaticus]
MAAKILPVVKFATKVTIAGGALYVAYDSGLLGGSEEGSVALGKAKAAIPPAVDEWMKYFGFELPATPKIEFSPLEAWNSGVQKSIHALSVAPSTVNDYTKQGLQYLKNLSK